MPEGGRQNHPTTVFGTGLETVEEGYGDELVILFKNCEVGWRKLPQEQLEAIRTLILYVHEAANAESFYICETPDNFDKLARALESEPTLRMRVQEIYSIYDDIKSYASKVLPHAKFAMRSECSRGETIFSICDLWWETYRKDPDFEEGEWLLTWLNDVDGRELLAEIRTKIKKQMSVGEKSLILHLHQGRYLANEDYINAFDESEHEGEDGDDVDQRENAYRLAYQDVLRASAAGQHKLRIEEFQYGDKDTLEEQDRIHHISEDTAYIEEGLIVLEGREFPHSFEALEFLFKALGYRSSLLRHKPVKFIHELVINW